MDVKIYYTKEEILKRAKEAIGVPIKNIDTTGRISTGKGAIGNIIEECWFGLTVNNENRPDFEEAGVELKVTPYQIKRNGITAKERLVCNIIDYMNEYKKTFHESDFWKKCNTILMMTYKHQDNVPKGDFTIDEVALYDYPEEDLIIIKKDWERIIGKIRDGRAHEISEGDTFYLGACTKGSTAIRSLREQPFSSIPAKQRAYCLKQSYMTSILRNYIFGEEQDEHIIKDISVLQTVGFTTYFENVLSPYLNKNRAELKDMFDISGDSKNINQLLISSIFKVKDIDDSDEFKKANIKIKTICMESDENRIKENMSFPVSSFKEIVNTDWENSREYDFLINQKYLFVVFKMQKGCLENKSTESDSDIILHSAFFWQMPEEDIEEVKRVWERAKMILIKGVELKEVKWGKGTRIENNLPKVSESHVAHMRPHTTVASYEPYSSNADELPDGRWMTKQSFWLNNDYILSQIKKNQRG